MFYSVPGGDKGCEKKASEVNKIWVKVTCKNNNSYQEMKINTIYNSELDWLEWYMSIKTKF